MKRMDEKKKIKITIENRMKKEWTQPHNTIFQSIADYKAMRYNRIHRRVSVTIIVHKHMTISICFSMPANNSII